MVVAGLVSSSPVAHGPGVDELSVEDVVAVGAANGWLIGEGRAALIARRGQQNRCRTIDAKVRVGGEIDPALGIDCTGKVVVQVGAFRHVAEEGEQKRG